MDYETLWLKPDGDMNSETFHEVFLLLGSNRGDRIRYLNQACRLIQERAGTILRVSPVYETEPWGFKDEIRFLNMALLIRTQLPPERLLLTILEIESLLGRKRILVPKDEKKDKDEYTSRTLDIDILFFDDIILQNGDLTIPHPRIHERKFVLVPMCDIGADYVHPQIGKKIKTLLKECGDRGEVVRFFP